MDDAIFVERVTCEAAVDLAARRRRLPLRIDAIADLVQENLDIGSPQVVIALVRPLEQLRRRCGKSRFRERRLRKRFGRMYARMREVAGQEHSDPQQTTPSENKTCVELPVAFHRSCPPLFRAARISSAVQVSRGIERSKTQDGHAVLIANRVPMAAKIRKWFFLQ